MLSINLKLLRVTMTCVANHFLRWAEFDIGFCSYSGCKCLLCLMLLLVEMDSSRTFTQ